MGATTLQWPSQKCCFVVRWWDLVEEVVNIWTMKRIIPDKDFCIKDIQVGTCKACLRISRSNNLEGEENQCRETTLRELWR